jgi:acyl carrier protein
MATEAMGNVDQPLHGAAGVPGNDGGRIAAADSLGMAFMNEVAPNDQQRLLAAFCGALGIDRETVTDELAYNSITEWDSVAHMTFVTEVETLFDIMLDTNDIIDMSSYGNIKKIIARYGVRLEG